MFFRDFVMPLKWELTPLDFGCEAEDFVKLELSKRWVNSMLSVLLNKRVYSVGHSYYFTTEISTLRWQHHGSKPTNFGEY